MISPGFESDNFPKASYEILPNEVYRFDLYYISEESSHEECLDFLSAVENQESLLVGVEGLSLLWQVKKKELPPEIYIFSLDSPDFLWEEPESQKKMLPALYFKPKKGWFMGLFPVDQKWGKGKHYILSVHKI